MTPRKKLIEVSTPLERPNFATSQEERLIEAVDRARADCKLDEVHADYVPREFADELIRKSAWWLEHPSGSVRAPNHADRLEELSCGWAVQFGANWFAAGRALASARGYAESLFELAAAGELPDEGEIYLQMQAIPGRCVLNFKLDFYDRYPDDGFHLLFGAQAINVFDCAEVFMRLSGVDRLIVEYAEVQSKA